MRIVVTGAAGFIGYHLVHQLLAKGHQILGIDNFNNYYDVNLKRSRIDNLINLKKPINSSLEIKSIDIEDKNACNEIFNIFKPKIVFHLAAQAGVRYSITNPEKYFHSNLIGFGNIMECCRKSEIKNFIFASSSSVYGGNKNIPFSELNSVDHPVSLYAATKRANELMAHSYSHLYQIPCTGLRLFTVYGPWGRPAMAPMIFANAIMNELPINIFNGGDLSRDFTYIDDVIEVFIRIMEKPAIPNSNFSYDKPVPFESWAPFRIFNVGNKKSIKLMEFIKLLEINLGKKAIKNFQEMQPGDVKDTLADTKVLEEWINFSPNTSLEFGISEFVRWFKFFY